MKDDSMQILKNTDLVEVVDLLKAGQIVVFPTETSYGLGCNAENQEAVDQVFNIKGRKNDKSLLIVVPNIEMAKKYLVWNELLEKMSAKFWPGPLTIVGEYKNDAGSVLAQGVVSKNGTIAVRVTNFESLRLLTAELGKPVVATSANISDAGDIYDSAIVKTAFQDKQNAPDALLDFGKLPFHKPTTIISVVNNFLQILRVGEITDRQLSFD